MTELAFYKIFSLALVVILCFLGIVIKDLWVKIQEIQTDLCVLQSTSDATSRTLIKYIIRYGVLKSHKGDLNQQLLAGENND